YVVQRGELTRLVDADHDGKAERYETVCDAWGVSGNYHEFAFGPKFDAEGNAWVTLNVGFCGGLGKSTVPWRGFAVKITPSGELVPVCDGLRSPNGFGANAAGDMFYVDNQGDYVATNRLAALTPKSWHGHPASLHWRDDVHAPTDRPERADPVVWFPYRKMGQSAADVVLDTTKGKFGPFADQLFVGDQMNCSVMRVALEKVDGKDQGACFPFLDGLDSGTNRIAFASDGSMFVGQTDRGWGSLGKKSYGLERVVYRDEIPFEILAMRARPHGFELEFTEEVDAKTAQDPRSYDVSSYTYEYHADYGAPEADTQTLAVTSARLVSPRVVQLALASLRKGYVHELTAAGVRSKSGEALVHTKAYYTLVRIPGGEQAVVVQDLSQVPAAAPLAKPKTRPKVLFLTQSKGFPHDVVKRPAPTELSLAEREFVALAKDDFEILPTQDSAAVNASDLTKYAAVAFYTTGELPISPENRAAFMEWMLHGGAFVGIHCASDTLYEYPPYQQMLGGTFDGHPWHQEIRVDVLDGAHPAVAQLERGFLITDEIYQFKNFDKIALRELLRVEPSSADFSKGKRTDGDYAISWCREYGQGRVFYTSLGHRPEVWMDPRFQKHLLGGLSWAVNGADWKPAPPEHSVILSGDFYGVSAWEKRDGSAAAWTSDDGVISAPPGAGDILTHHIFGDADIHVEFSVPDDPGEGEARGNSGVYLMGRYEVQVLDSFGNTPGKGDCGAIYGQTAPSMNACKPALAWQTFDIRLKGPRIGADGKKTANARVSVWLNGVLVQDDFELKSATPGGISDQEVAAGPLLLQEHGHAVRYRNIWIVPR
ncbi:MAG TPA: ThuA domain-containing protein, partial [Planctomycetota bacterium]|nr:ThuA domain-containing protein [Planctomycetota bacterium]